MLGEPVVRTVISASEQLKAAGEPGCDYADLCGEPSFIERMHLKVSLWGLGLEAGYHLHNRGNIN